MSRMLLVAISALWLLMGLPGPAGAQEEAATEEPVEEAVEETAAEPAPTQAPPVATVITSDGRITMDFKDADIRQVLRVLSLKSGVDIVAGNDVEGLVTIKLTNVPWEEALDTILRTYGFTYERKGKIIRVMTLEALEQEALATEVFPLDYANAKNVPDVIQEMLSERGRVKFDERTNTVIVTDIPSTLFQIRQVVQRLDQRTPQVLIETKVVETKLEKDENLGINWSDSATATLTSATIPSTFPFLGGSKMGSVGQSFIPRAGEFSPSTGATLPQGRVPERGGTFTFGTLTSSSLSMVLNFLAKRTDTQIVSNPTIAVLNNQEAKIHIGEEYPVPSYTVDPTTGRTSISGYTPKNTGTVLTVTPHVNPSLEIVVDLKPEIITVGTDVSYSLAGTDTISFPRFTTQTAQTSVRVTDGDTVAIGGLVKTSDAKIVEKVPFLGDLPLVGWLFKQERWYSGGSDPVRQDLLIFLTVKLMKEYQSQEQAVASAPSPAAPY